MTATELPMDNLQSLISMSQPVTYVEARYHIRSVIEIQFTNAELVGIRSVESAGCGIRVLVDGCWGFSSTNSASTVNLRKALLKAVSSAKALGGKKNKKVLGLAECRALRGTFKSIVNGELSD